MNFFYTLVLASSSFFVFSDAACPVCSCASPSPFTEAVFNSTVLPLQIIDGSTFKLVKVEKVSVVDCAIQVTCNFDAPGAVDYMTVAITTQNTVSSGTNLNDVTCNNGKWLYSGEEVASVGCYTSEFVEPEF